MPYVIFLLAGFYLLPILAWQTSQMKPSTSSCVPIDLTAAYQAHRPTLQALNRALRQGEAARFQALFQELSPSLRRAVRDGFLERLCILGAPTALEGQERILQALVEQWGALPTRSSLREATQGPFSATTQALLRTAWEEAKEALDQAAGRGDLPGVQQAIFRGVMPDLTTWAHAWLSEQHNVLDHLAPYGLSQEKILATAYAWGATERQVYKTLFLMGAREGQVALIELVERKAPELLQDPRLVEQALRQAVQSGHPQALGCLKGHYERLKIPLGMLPDHLLNLALIGHQPETLEAVMTLFPPRSFRTPLDLLSSTVRSGQVALFKCLDQRLGYAWSSQGFWSRVSYTHLTLPMLKAIVEAHPASLKRLEEHHLVRLVLWGHSYALLPWLHEQRPDLLIKRNAQERFFVQALKSGNLEVVRAAKQMTPELSLTQEMLTTAFRAGNLALLEHIMEMPLKQELSQADLKKVLLGAVHGGHVEHVTHWLALHPEALEGIQGHDDTGTDWRDQLLQNAIASQSPQMVAWFKPLLDRAWLQGEGYGSCFHQALRRARLPVCQAMRALAPDYRVTQACLDRALFNQEHAVFDWLQAQAPGVMPSPQALERLATSTIAPDYAWVYTLQERGYPITPRLHHAKEAIQQGDLARVAQDYNAHAEPWEAHILLWLQSQGEQEVWVRLLQRHQGHRQAEKGEARQVLMSHDQGGLPSDLVGVVMGYL